MKKSKVDENTDETSNLECESSPTLSLLHERRFDDFLLSQDEIYHCRVVSREEGKEYESDVNQPQIVVDIGPRVSNRAYKEIREDD